MLSYFVVVVNGDLLDSHAHETFKGALDLANVDAGDTWQVYLVNAYEAGQARLANELIDATSFKG